jgi:hypothetical protein
MNLKEKEADMIDGERMVLDSFPDPAILEFSSMHPN